MAEYISQEKSITAKPRSKRLQQVGTTVASTGGTTIIGGTSGTTVTDPNSHTHANKSDLDKLSLKDGYVEITEKTIADDGSETSTTNKAKAGTADNLAEDSTDWDKIARKDLEQTIAEKYKFVKGAEFGDYVKDATGGAVWKDDDGNWHIEGDFFHIRKKLTAETVEIMHSSHIGGKLISTGGRMIITKVETGTGYYRCYFAKKDSDGHIIYNTFGLNDLAYCETFNLIDSTGKAANHYWWRKVLALGDDYVDIADNTDSTLYGAESDLPMVGDDVSTLGNTDNKDRQGALIMAGAGEESPYLRCYTGISGFTLPTPSDQISPNGSWLTVKDSGGNKIMIQELLNKMNSSISSIKQQTDQQIVIWFVDEIPTSANAPASDWTTDAMKAEHEHDICYNKSAATTGGGRAYSWELTNGTYGWTEITDKDVLTSLEAAEKAQETADGKIRAFVAQPTTNSVYDIGDEWLNATYPTGTDTYTLNGTTYTSDNPLYNNDTLRATTAKAAGTAFDIAHWTPISSVTTAKINVMTSQIEAIVQKISPSGITSSGVVLIDSAGKMYTSSVGSDGKAVTAEIKTLVRMDDNGNIVSGITLSADQIDFKGKTVINNKFVVAADGSVTLTDFTAVNGTFTGVVHATSGDITNLTVGEGETQLIIASKDGVGGVVNQKGAGLKYTDGKFELRFGNTYMRENYMYMYDETNQWYNSTTKAWVSQAVYMYMQPTEFICESGYNTFCVRAGSQYLEIVMANLPTSSDLLGEGRLWRDGDTIKIKTS